MEVNAVIAVITEIENEYRFSSNKCRASDKHRPLMSTAPFGIHIEISGSL